MTAARSRLVGSKWLELPFWSEDWRLPNKSPGSSSTWDCSTKTWKPPIKVSGTKRNDLELLKKQHYFLFNGDLTTAQSRLVGSEWPLELIWRLEAAEQLSEWQLKAQAAILNPLIWIERFVKSPLNGKWCYCIFTTRGVQRRLEKPLDQG